MRTKDTFSLIAAGLLGGGAAYAFGVRPWMHRWGATDEEIRRVLPGDDLLLHPRLDVTHAVTVHAPADRVWPWIAQIGQGRGGFYSYDFIENAMGLDIESIDHILPQHQNVQVGDTLPLAPGGFGIPVAIVDPCQSLVLHGDTRQGELPPEMKLRPGDYLATVWGWHLFEQPDGSTRLVERWLADWNPSALNFVMYRVFLETAFLMERKMLLGIKQRAERPAA
jgi:hypothetical protein